MKQSGRIVAIDYNLRTGTIQISSGIKYNFRFADVTFSRRYDITECFIIENLKLSQNQLPERSK